MCLPNLMKFYQRFFKILRKQNVTDTRSDGRSDNVKTVYPPTNIVCGGYNNTTKLFVNAINMYVTFNLLILEKHAFLKIHFLGCPGNQLN